MEYLVDQLLIEKEIKRYIKILNLLSTRKKMELKELEKMLDITRKTLKHDLSVLFRNSPESISLKIDKHNVVMFYEDKENIQDYIFLLIEKSLVYRILEYAYDQPVITLEVIAKKLYTSISTLKKRIFHINDVLKKYGCKLSTYTSKFNGSEANIRYFYYTYYNELQELFDFNKKQSIVKHQELFNALEEELIRKKLKKINYNYFRIRQWLLITRDRLNANNNVSLQKAFVNKIIVKQSYIDFKDVYLNIMYNYFNIIDLSDDEIVWAYITCLEAVVYSKDSNALVTCRDDNYTIEQIKTNEVFLYEMAQTLGIKRDDISEFIVIHSAFFSNLSLLNKLTYSFQMIPIQVEEYIKQILSNLYSIWREKLVEINKKHQLHIVHLDAVSCKLASITSQFVFTNKPEAKKILFSFSGESGLTTYLETVSKILFSDKVECVFVFNELLSMKLIESIEPDIVVYNYNNIEVIDFPYIIKIAQLPSLKDWTDLNEYVLNL